MSDFEYVDHVPEDFTAAGAEAHICATQANPVLYIEGAIKRGLPGAVVAWSESAAETEARAATIIARSAAAAKEFGGCHKRMAAYFRHEAQPQRQAALQALADPDHPPKLRPMMPAAAKFHVALADHRDELRRSPHVLGSIEFALTSTNAGLREDYAAELRRRDLRVFAAELKEFDPFIKNQTHAGLVARLVELRDHGAAAVRRAVAPEPAAAPAPTPAPARSSSSNHAQADAARPAGNPRDLLGWRRWDHLQALLEQGPAPGSREEQVLRQVLDRFDDQALASYFLRADQIARETSSRDEILRALAAGRQALTAGGGMAHSHGGLHRSPPIS